MQLNTDTYVGLQLRCLTTHDIWQTNDVCFGSTIREEALQFLMKCSRLTCESEMEFLGKSLSFYLTMRVNQTPINIKDYSY